ncbi:MAG: SRPBCC family protein [Solirubrobacterales bacterium]|nr:SRPBCC family protein [Solirubrobacterales bacterium]
MPTIARSRRIPAPSDRVWALVSDPHNLPRWWPETVRVEDVHGRPGSRRSRFTQVFETSKGKPVRADFRCIEASAEERIVWEQELEGTPFAGFLRDAELELRLESSADGTEVTVEGRRRLRGLSKLGAPMMRRATGRTLSAALEGIEAALCGLPEPR